ncbi:hypothetical protein ACT691_16160 [Vibrio metschnikovii]
MILGSTGRNFAAGYELAVSLTCGIKPVIFHKNSILKLVDLDPIEAEDKALLKDMLTKHVQFTGSEVSTNIPQQF